MVVLNFYIVLRHKAVIRIRLFPLEIDTSTLLQYPTQVRFWIHLKIPTEYDYRMPRLPENEKIKIPQVGTHFTL